MEVEQRIAHFQNFIKNNLPQLHAIPDMDEQARYLVGAVEYYFVNVEPKLADISEGEFTEPEVVNVTPDPSNDFGEIKVPGT